MNNYIKRLIEASNRQHIKRYKRFIDYSMMIVSYYKLSFAYMTSYILGAYTYNRR